MSLNKLVIVALASAATALIVTETLNKPTNLYQPSPQNNQEINNEKETTDSFQDLPKNNKEFEDKKEWLRNNKKVLGISFNPTFRSSGK